jgi:hypothetical protein
MPLEKKLYLLIIYIVIVTILITDCEKVFSNYEFLSMRRQASIIFFPIVDLNRSAK